MTLALKHECHLVEEYVCQHTVKCQNRNPKTFELLRPRRPITQTVSETLPSTEIGPGYKMLPKSWGPPL